MRIRRPQLNTLLLCVLLPALLLSEMGFLAYVVLATYLLARVRFKALAILALAGVATWAATSWSPVFDDLSWQMKANAFNATYAYFLLLLSRYISFNFRLAPSLFADCGILLLLTTGIVLGFAGVIPPAVLQLGSFSTVMYFTVGNTPARRILAASSLLFAGARSVAAGLVVGLMFSWSRRVTLIVAVLALLTALILLALPSSVVEFEGYLAELQRQGVLLKGRVSYWLVLASGDRSLLGNGAGWSIYTIEYVYGYFQLPHNEYLRVYGDYGAIGLALLLTSLFWNVYRGGAPQFFATLILAFFMLTGNPLSFPTVIVSYLFARNAILDGQPTPPTPRRPASRGVPT